MSDLHTRIIISARDAATSTLNRVEGSFRTMERRVGVLTGRMGMLMGAAGIGGVTMGFAEARQAAVAFETSLRSMARVTDRDLGAIKEEVLALSGAYGSGTELMSGYYQVMSAGIRDSAKAQDILVAGAKLAKDQQVAQGESIKGLTKLMSLYEGQVRDAADAADVLYAIERDGVTTVQETIPYIGDLASSYSTLGVGVEEMAATFMQITQVAGNTGNAATQARGLVMAMLKPTERLREFVGELGYASTETMVAQEGWLGALRRITGAAQSQGMELGRLFESQEALLGIQAAMRGDFEQLEQRIRAVGDRAGLAAKSWESFSEGSKQAGDRFVDTWDRVAIVAGTQASPAINGLLNSTSDWLDDNEGRLADWAETGALALDGLVHSIRQVADIYLGLPDEVTGPAGYGLVGAILGGRKGGLAGMGLWAALDLEHRREGFSYMLNGLLSEDEIYGDDKARDAAIARARQWVAQAGGDLAKAAELAAQAAGEQAGGGFIAGLHSLEPAIFDAADNIGRAVGEGLTTPDGFVPGLHSLGPAAEAAADEVTAAAARATEQQAALREQLRGETLRLQGDEVAAARHAFQQQYEAHKAILGARSVELAQWAAAQRAEIREKEHERELKDLDTFMKDVAAREEADGQRRIDLADDVAEDELDIDRDKNAAIEARRKEALDLARRLRGEDLDDQREHLRAVYDNAAQHVEDLDALGRWYDAEMAELQRQELERRRDAATTWEDYWRAHLAIVNGEYKTAAQQRLEEWERTAEAMIEVQEEFEGAVKDGLSSSLVAAAKGEFEKMEDIWSDVLDRMLEKAADFAVDAAWEFAGLSGSGGGGGGADWWNYLGIYHQGAWSIGEDEHPAILQQGEMVIPAGPAEQIRQGLNDSGFGSDAYGDLADMVSQVAVGGNMLTDEQMEGVLTAAAYNTVETALKRGYNIFQGASQYVDTPEAMRHAVVGALAVTPGTFIRNVLTGSLTEAFGLDNELVDLGFLGGLSANNVVSALLAVASAAGLTAGGPLGVLLSPLLGAGVTLLADALNVRSNEAVRDELEERYGWWEGQRRYQQVHGIAHLAWQDSYLTGDVAGTDVPIDLDHFGSGGQGDSYWGMDSADIGSAIGSGPQATEVGEYSEYDGYARGGVITRAHVPDGEDGLVAVQIGEGVVSRRGMDALAQINQGDPAPVHGPQQSFLLATAQGVVDQQEALVEARQDEAERIQETIDSLEDQARAASQAQQSWESLADAIGNHRLGLATNDNLSPLSHADQLAAARARYEDVAARALAGDQDAMGQLTAVSTEYLAEAREYYASSEDYYQIWQTVSGKLDMAETLAESQAEASSEQVTLAQEQLAVQEQLLLAMQELVAMGGAYQEVAGHGVYHEQDGVATVNLEGQEQFETGYTYSQFLQSSWREDPEDVRRKLESLYAGDERTLGLVRMYMAMWQGPGKAGVEPGEPYSGGVVTRQEQARITREGFAELNHTVDRTGREQQAEARAGVQATRQVGQGVQDLDRRMAEVAQAVREAAANNAAGQERMLLVLAPMLAELQRGNRQAASLGGALGDWRYRSTRGGG